VKTSTSYSSFNLLRQNYEEIKAFTQKSSNWLKRQKKTFLRFH